MTARDDPLLAQWQYGLGRSVAWTSDSTGRWARDWLGWSGFSQFFSQLVSWTFPGEETGGIEATFDDGPARPRCTSRASSRTARRATSTRRAAVVVGPDLEPQNVTLVQVAPGVYEVPLGEIDPGAYAVRVTQTRPGASPLGRTVGLVAPTAAEYRLLGHERAVPGGGPCRDRRLGDHDARAAVAPRPDRPPTASPICGRCCSSWPCCCGRSTSRSGACRSGVARSRPPARGCAASAAAGAASPRARARARACSRRAAGRRRARRGPRLRGEPADERRRAATEAATATAARRRRPSPPRPRRPAVATPAPAPPAPASPPPRRRPSPRRAAPPPATTSPPPPAAAEPADTMARLRDAKRRARER